MSTLDDLRSSGLVDPLNITGGKDSDDPPSISEQVSQAVQGQINVLPQILEAQRKFGPQFTELELEQLKRFGGQFAQEQVDIEGQVAPQLAEINREALSILSPERVAAQDLLADFFSQEQGLSDTEREVIQEQSRAAQSVRGLAESGFGAVEEVRALADFRNQIRQQQLNLALNSSSGVGTVPGLSMNTPNVSTGQLVQNVTPSQIFGAQNAQTGFNLSQQQRRDDLFGGIIGAVGTIGGAMIGGPAGAAVGSSLTSGIR